MAKSVGLVGNIRNKAGNVIFKSWKSIQCITSNPHAIRNHPAPGEIITRSKFKTIVEYSSAMNKLPFLKHLWKLTTVFPQSATNTFFNTNFKKAIFESDNSLCSNRVIIAENNDNIKPLALSGKESCSDGIWTLDGLNFHSCGINPDGIILIQIFNSNHLADPGQAPFRGVRICEDYKFPKSFPINILSNIPHYQDIFDICCSECATPEICYNSSLWVIPVFSNGVDASSNPGLITKAGTPLLICAPITTPVADPVFFPISGSNSDVGDMLVSISCSTFGATIYYTIADGGDGCGVPPDPPDPTAFSTEYTEPFHIFGSSFGNRFKIKAIAIFPGSPDSNVVIVSYLVIRFFY
jgi:hypothetical protein